MVCFFFDKLGGGLQKTVCAALLALTLVPIVAVAEDFTDDNGLTYTVSEVNAVSLTKVSKTSGQVTIPATVTHGGVTYEVTSIGKNAFSLCSGLTEVTIPAGVTSIGNEAFSGCTKLSDVTLPANVSSLGYRAFFGCSGITHIDLPASVTSIGQYAFGNCSGITSVDIPASVTNIGEGAFVGCSNLSYITVHEGNVAYKSAGGALYSSDGAVLLQYPASKMGDLSIPDGVRDIGNYAFYGCLNRSSFTLPTSVTCIGNNAFYRCSNLTRVDLPASVTSIGDMAFEGCNEDLTLYVMGTDEQVESFRTHFQDVLPDKVNIEQSTSSTTVAETFTEDGFTYEVGEGNTATLMGAPETSEQVTVPSTVTSFGVTYSVTGIGTWGFRYCPNLTSVDIPASVTSIDNSAFHGCPKLAIVTVAESNEAYESIDGALYSADGTTLMLYPAATKGDATVPTNVTNIGSRAFYGCSGLTSITLPDGVTDIGDQAFYDCSNLASVYIPAKVANIGWRAFDNCYNLKSVRLIGSDEDVEPFKAKYGDLIHTHGVSFERASRSLTPVKAQLHPSGPSYYDLSGRRLAAPTKAIHIEVVNNRGRLVRRPK